MTVRVVLAHGGTLVRKALAALLTDEEDIEVVAEADDRDEVLLAAERRQPHVTIVDFEWSSAKGTLTVADVFRVAPACSVLLLVDLNRWPAITGTLLQQVPRVGFLAKDASPVGLTDAIRRLARGDPVLDPRLAVAALRGQGNPLTAREREILSFVADGATAKEIAGWLHLAPGTVRNHLSRVLQKTGARTRIEAIRIARDAGWL